MTAREKKAKQRAAKRAAGFVEVSVWVAPEQVDALREFAASLPQPRREIGGPSLFDCLDADPPDTETSRIGGAGGSSR